jgi:hypothetical protein
VFEKERHDIVPSRETFDLFLAIAQFSRHCSKINKRLYSAASLIQPPSRIIESILDLYQELNDWWSSVAIKANVLDPEDLPNVSTLSSPADFTRCVILRSWYYCSLFSLHHACREPGFVMFEKNVDSVTLAQSTKLTQIAEEGIAAARSMCLLIQQVKIEAHTPQW